MTTKSVEKETVDWYKRRYEQKGKDRDSLLKNPEVLFQTLAYDKSVIKALSSININPLCTKVLDVGCGGGSLINFLRLGFITENLTGIDIQKERILEARRRFPNIKFNIGDAQSMPFEDESFDIVTESTMFVQLIDDRLSRKIAKEMIRVTKTGSYIVLVDWRYSKPWDKSYKGLSIKRINDLFMVNSKTKILGVYKGALIPPIGRFLSKKISSIYFIVQSIFPFFVGQQTTVLKKISCDDVL